MTTTTAGRAVLPFVETFGKTVQGEGPAAGRAATFLRFGGCNLSCSWCTVPGMLILRPDFTWTPVEDLAVGDVVLGRSAPHHGKQGVLMKSTVTATSRRIAPLVRVNGNLTCSADKQVWLAQNRTAHSGWREVTRCEGLKAAFLAEPTKRDQAEYERGYLAGMADGDGTFWTLRPGGTRQEHHRFRLALNDHGLLDRTRQFAANAGFTLRPGTHTHTGYSASRESMKCLWLTISKEAVRFDQWCQEDPGTESWAWGYLGGIFDAEGNIGKNGAPIRIAQYASGNGPTYERIDQAARRCGFTTIREPRAIRIKGTPGEVWRFLVGATPAKRSALDLMIGRAPHSSRTIKCVEPVDEGEVVSLTTSTGNYFAEGWLVHNCDSAFTWNGADYDLREQITSLPVEDILARVDTTADIVVVTGGEPLLHQGNTAWPLLLAGLRTRFRELHLETNGTIAPNRETRERFHLMCVSPKQGHAGPHRGNQNPALHPDWVDVPGAVLKIVVKDPAGVDEAVGFAQAGGWPLTRVWVMPEGITPAVLNTRWPGIAARAAELGVNASHRLHVLAWGDERGH